MYGSIIINSSYKLEVKTKKTEINQRICHRNRRREIEDVIDRTILPQQFYHRRPKRTDVIETLDCQMLGVFTSWISLK